MRYMRAIRAVTLTAVVSATALSSSQRLSPLAPLDPVVAILDAFRTHAIVALSDPHGDEQMHDFLLALIRHPDFSSRVNDLLVEGASARYQSVVDGYVRGEKIDLNAVLEAWRNSTQHQILDAPLAESSCRPSARSTRSCQPSDGYASCSVIRRSTGTP